MKTIRLLALLLIVGCVRIPLEPGRHVTIAADDPSFGYIIDPDAWHCRHVTDGAGACQQCVNISDHAAELSTGYERPNGEWEISSRHYRPGSVVRLCEPVLKRVALWQQ